MSLVSRVAAMTSKAWGQFKSGLPSIAGNYLYLWGSNASAALGQYIYPSSASRNSPVQIGTRIWSSTLNISKFSNGGSAIDSNGALWIWGSPGISLGDGTTVGKSSPVQLGTLTNWATVSSGDSFTVAIRTDGTLWATGANASGQLGDGSTTNRSSPVQVGTLTNWSKISAGSACCLAIKTDGTLWSWGNGVNGKLGNGSTANISSPVQIGTLTTWTAVSAGGASYAISGGGLYAWGSAQFGMLGNGTTTPNLSSPVQIGTLTNWSIISGGNSGASAIKTDGTLWSWGKGSEGSLGDGTTIQKSSPVQIGTLTNWSNVSVGDGFSFALKNDGTAWAWGSGLNGVLGQSSTTNYSSPIQVTTSTNYTAVSAGLTASAQINNGYLFTIGNPAGGQLAQQRASNSSPVVVGLGTDKFIASSGGDAFSIAISQNRNLYGWGQNIFGQLGNGTTNAATDYPSYPIQVNSDTNWTAVRAYSSNVTALKSTNTLWAWGSTASGLTGLGVVGSTVASNAQQIPNQLGNIKISTASTSLSFGMFISTTGALYGIGLNSKGQLGDGTSITKSSPVQIGTLTNWSKIATLGSNNAGGGSVAAIKTDGTLWAWGLNNYGQLGNGTTTTSSSPVQIGTLTNWSNISVDPNNGGFKATKSDGTLWTWGDNTYLQLGIGANNTTTTTLSFPMQYGQNGAYSDIAPSYGFALLQGTGNQLYAVGDNTYGALGDSTLVSKSSPIQIGTLTNWSKISVGVSTSYGIKADNTLWAWGLGESGELGVGGNYNTGWQSLKTSSPVQCAFNNWSSVEFGSTSATDYTGAAINSSGELWMWGYNAYGQLGNGTTNGGCSPGPIPLGADKNWAQITSGENYKIARKTNGTLWGWGWGGYLGTSVTTNYSSPVQIGTLTTWSSVTTGLSSTMALRSDNTLWAWGSNDYGQLGNGTTTTYSSPIQVGTLTSWSSASMGSYHSLMIRTTGSLWASGFNTSGQLGNGATLNQSSPVQIGTLTNWAKVFAGQQNSFAIKSDGSLWSWGQNQSGSLGQGDLVNRSSPTQVGTLTNWSKVAAALYSTLAVKTDGTLWAWGYNNYGQLGTGNTVDYSSPVQIGTLTNWIDVALNGGMAMAVNSSGGMYSWGNNYEPAYNVPGVLGVAPPKYCISPVQVGTQTNWSNVAGSFTCASGVKTDNTLWSWGSNSLGATGRGLSTGNTESPVQVGTLTNWSKVSMGYQYGIAIKTDGTVWGWGRNDYNNINGTTLNYSSPVQIGTLTTWSDVNLNPNTYTTVILKNDGTAWAQGNNGGGQAGVNTAATQVNLTQVTLGGTITKTYAGYRSSGFIVGNNAYAAGYLVGDGSLTAYSSPVQVGAIANYSKIAFAEYLGFAISTSNVLYGWGQDLTYLKNNPTPLAGVSSPVQVGTQTNWSTPNIKSDGSLWTWGNNANGQLGTGDTFNRDFPAQVGTLTNWKTFNSQGRLDTTQGTSVAVKTDGTLWAFGYNQGSFGNNTLTAASSPVQIGTLTTWSDAVTSGFNSLFLSTNNSLWSTGLNASYQLGDGTTVAQSSAVQIGSTTNFAKVFPWGGDQYSFPFVLSDQDLLYTWSTLGGGFNKAVVGTSITSPTQLSMTGWTSPFIRNGALWVFGLNLRGQLGVGDTFDRLGPVQVGTLTNWSKILFSQSHAVALKTDGTLWTWGDASNGRLGSGLATPNRSSPAQVGTLTDWADIAVGSNFNLAIKTDGTLWSWGANTNGRLGDGTTITKSSPVQIGTLTTWSKIGAYLDNGAAIRTDGTLWAWGLNSSGEVGDGTTTSRSSPVQIGTLTTWVNLPSSAFGSFVGAFRSN